MTNDTPAGPGDSDGPLAGESGESGDAAQPLEPRKPRKIFLVVGVVLALVLGIFLFTGLGTSDGSTGGGSGSGSGGGGAPQAGSAVPTFTRTNVGPTGGSQVTVSPGGTGGRPTVLLFFGNWCPSCHQELPPLAAAVRSQSEAGGALSGIRVVGVDSEDTVAHAKSFIHSAGVTFPVAYDYDTSVTNGLFYFTGDPYAVFVKGDGKIARIVRGDVLTPSSLTADERALIPSGT
ncbi:MAG TPA: TlpA disulfide reductase family protein [Acidimicrobiales bacterium]